MYKGDYFSFLNKLFFIILIQNFNRHRYLTSSATHIHYSPIRHRSPKFYLHHVIEYLLLWLQHWFLSDRTQLSTKSETRPQRPTLTLTVARGLNLLDSKNLRSPFCSFSPRTTPFFFFLFQDSQLTSHIGPTQQVQINNGSLPPWAMGSIASLVMRGAFWSQQQKIWWMALLYIFLSMNRR